MNLRAPIGPGTILGGRYVLEARLGQGGAGDVWAANDGQGGPVAIKLLHHVHLDEEDMRARFVREGELLARISSRRVCRLLAMRTDGPVPFLVLERLTGVGLNTALRGGRALPFAEVSLLIEDILSGLAAIHDVGIVHRDLKPANVFLADEPDGGASGARCAKLLDFGIASGLHGEVRLTTRSATLGSPLYMAPEQLRGALDADARSDIYAAATIAFRALTGHLPFDAASLLAAVALKRMYPAPTLRERTGHDWPAPLERFFEATLAIEPDARPPDAHQTLVAWRHATETLRGAGAPKHAPPSASFDNEDHDTPVCSRRPRVVP
jgi:serine/threonine-protein kinase